MAFVAWPQAYLLAFEEIINDLVFATVGPGAVTATAVDDHVLAVPLCDFKIILFWSKMLLPFQLGPGH